MRYVVSKALKKGSAGLLLLSLFLFSGLAFSQGETSQSSNSGPSQKRFKRLVPVPGRFVVSSRKKSRTGLINQEGEIFRSSAQTKLKDQFQKIFRKTSRLSLKSSRINKKLLKIQISELEKLSSDQSLVLLEGLKSDPDFVIEPDYKVEIQEVAAPNDPYFPPSFGAWGQSFANQWPLQKLQISQAWTASQGAGITVAVIDTGVDYNHPDLIGRIINGFDFVNEDSDSMDDHFHGTHVAGTIVANANNGIGISGIAPAAQVLAIKVLDKYGSGYLSDVADAIVYAANNGAKVINLSLGGQGETPQYLVDALEHAHQRDVMVIAAAGNSNLNLRDFSPASDPLVIAVGATNSQDQKASFSNYGERLTLSAPGGGDVQGGSFPESSILSLKAKTYTGSSALVVNGDYLRLSGTSMAAPHAAGVAALLRAKFPNYSSGQIRQMLQLGADDLGVPGFDREFGIGRMNAHKALSISYSPIEVLLKNRQFIIENQETLELSGIVKGENLERWEINTARYNSYGLLESQTLLSGRYPVDGVLGTISLSTIIDFSFPLYFELVAYDTSGRKFTHRSDLVIRQNQFISPKGIDLISGSTLRPALGKTAHLKARVAPFATSVTLELLEEPLKRTIPTSIQVIKNGIDTEFLEAVWDASGLPSGVYTFRLTTYAPDYKNTVDLPVILDQTLKLGWPLEILKDNPPLSPNSRYSMGNKLKAVVLDDTGPSKLFFDYLDKIFLVDSTGKNVPGWPVTRPNALAGVYSFSAAGDVNGDGTIEIVSCHLSSDWGGEVLIFKGDGSLLKKWRLPNGEPSQQTFLIDLDGDGKKEILCPGEKKLFAFNSNGEPIPGWPFTLRERFSSLASRQISGQREAELYVIEQPSDLNRSSIIHAVDKQGRELLGWPKSVPFGVFDHFSVDLDGNGKSDLVVRSNEEIRALNDTGSVMPGWPMRFSAGSNTLQGLSVGDIDGDGSAEVIATTRIFRTSSNFYYSMIYAFTKTGSAIANFPLVVPSPLNGIGGGGAVSPALVDLDGDGKLDIVGHSTRYSGGTRAQAVHAFNYLGQELSGFPKLTSNTADDYSSPAVTDLDGDGKLDLLWIDGDLRVYAWDLDSPTTSLSTWRMASADASRSFWVSLPTLVSPGAPTSLTGTAGDGQVALSWNAPSDTSGAAITDYVIEYKLVSSGSWTVFVDGVSSTTTASITGLTNGSAYDFRVAAINAAGTGSYAETSSSITPFGTPGAPTSVTGTAGDGQVLLSWVAPDNSGGSPITDYVIEYRSSNGSAWLLFSDEESSTTFSVITGLTNGSAYDFRVAAINAAGTGSYAETSSSITPYGMPSAPTSVTGTTGDGQVALSWNAPSDTSGAAITDYVIEYKPVSSGSWTVFVDGVSSTTTASITGLTNGSAYDFRVAAINSAGTGSYAETSSSITPHTTPSAPTSVTGTAGDGEVLLTWTAPPSDGGRRISNYSYQYSSANGTTWSTAALTGSSSTTVTVRGLTNGTTYIFQVAAINAAGTGSYAQTTSSITPHTTPGAPTSVTGTPGDGQVALHWVAPPSNGGNHISNYAYEYSSDGGRTWSATALTGSSSTTVTVRGLTNGATYIFRVAAINAAGTGSYSSDSPSYTPCTAPGAPTSVTGTDGDGQVLLSWVAPSSNGGNQISNYSYQHSSDSGRTWSASTLTGSSSTRHLVRGLTNGTPYIFRIAAANSQGVGAYSAASSPITPATTPNAPTKVVAKIKTGRVSITFIPPTTTGGAEITHYFVRYSRNKGKTWILLSPPLGAPRTPAFTIRVPKGGPYIFQLAAKNRVGQGIFSGSSNRVTVP